MADDYSGLTYYTILGRYIPNFDDVRICPSTRLGHAMPQYKAWEFRWEDFEKNEHCFDVSYTISGWINDGPNVAGALGQFLEN